MASKNIGLISRDDVKRIGFVVRDYERRPRSNIGPPTGSCPPPGRVGEWKVITGACTRYGVYVGRGWNYGTSGTFNSATATTWDSSDIGAATGANVTIINEAERGQSTHALTESGVIVVRVWCTPAGFKDSAGRDVWITNALTGSDSCTPL